MSLDMNTQIDLQDKGCAIKGLVEPLNLQDGLEPLVVVINRPLRYKS